MNVGSLGKYGKSMWLENCLGIGFEILKIVR